MSFAEIIETIHSHEENENLHCEVVYDKEFKVKKKNYRANMDAIKQIVTAIEGDVTSVLKLLDTMSDIGFSQSKLLFSSRTFCVKIEGANFCVNIVHCTKKSTSLSKSLNSTVGSASSSKRKFYIHILVYKVIVDPF